MFDVEAEVYTFGHDDNDLTMALVLVAATEQGVWLVTGDTTGLQAAFKLDRAGHLAHHDYTRVGKVEEFGS